VAWWLFEYLRVERAMVFGVVSASVGNYVTYSYVIVSPTINPQLLNLCAAPKYEIISIDAVRAHH
jgi:hypothetical protein